MNSAEVALRGEYNSILWLSSARHLRMHPAREGIGADQAASPTA